MTEQALVGGHRDPGTLDLPPRRRLAQLPPALADLGDEDEPGTVQLVSTILRRQSEASGYLRRSLVVALRAEGQSIPSIAHLFGVTHQRVSNLLRRVAQGNADGNTA